MRALRRTAAGIAAAALLAALGGCGGGTEPGERYLLYYPKRDLNDAGTGALGTELSETVSEDPRAAAEALMAALLSGPADEGLRNAFPAGTALRSLELRGTRAAVDLSSEYAALSGVALTLADSAVALTLTQIPEISLVRITVRGQELAYRERQSFTARDVLLEPEGDVVGVVRATLYFPDAAGELTGEERTLSLYEGDTQAETVAAAVEAGPEGGERAPAFPEDFHPRAAWQEGTTCFVNLSSALPEGVDAAALSRALRALDWSLCSLDSIREVRYLVDGEFADTYGGVSLVEPYDPA